MMALGLFVSFIQHDGQSWYNISQGMKMNYLIKMLITGLYYDNISWYSQETRVESHDLQRIGLNDLSFMSPKTLLDVMLAAMIILCFFPFWFFRYKIYERITLMM